MRYLIIGDAGSMHIFNFVKTVLLPKNYEVHLLTLSARPVRDNFRTFYRENGVFVHSIAEKNYRNLDKRDRFHRLLNIFRKLRLMHDVPQVDICHIHSVYKTACVMALRNKKKYKKLILSYWGGDIEDKATSVIKLRQKCFKYAGIITVTVKETYNKFREIYGTGYDDKLRICRFATDGLACIKNISEEVTRTKSREMYGIPQKKICITCGYSAYAEQHQDKCLEIIGTLQKNVREKLFVIVPMQYGRFDSEYIEKVRKAAEKADVEFSILEEFVPFEMSARLAIATDIYLHLRDTDAFSNALKEQVFAGSFIIKGDWLKYLELDEMKAQLASISSFEMLGDCLDRVIHDIKVSDNITLFLPIYEMYSTDAIVKQWNEVIEIVKG